MKDCNNCDHKITEADLAALHKRGVAALPTDTGCRLPKSAPYGIRTPETCRDWKPIPHTEDATKIDT